MRCNLCGSERNKMFVERIYSFKNKNYNLVKCLKCGFVFVEPMPSANERREMYSEKYFEDNKVSGFREKGYKDDEEFYADRYKLILNNLRKIKPSGKILEIGSAGGYFLNMARDAGYEVQGVEISKWAVDFSRKKFGLKVFNGELENAKFLDGNFNIVVAGNVLEHVENPMKFISEASRVLQKNGVFVVEVPYFINSPYFPFARFLFGKLIHVNPENKEFLEFMKINKYGAISLPYHLYEFSLSSIRDYLKKNGFKIIKIDSTFTEPSLKYSSAVNLFVSAVYKSVNLLMKVFGIKFCNITFYAKKMK